MKLNLKILSSSILAEYLKIIPNGVELAFKNLRDAELSTKSFSFYTSVASVFSSKIEGEEIELDNYVKHKRDGIKFLPDYTKKIDDLYNAYTFAKSNELNEINILKAHKLLSKNILKKLD